MVAMNRICKLAGHVKRARVTEEFVAYSIKPTRKPVTCWERSCSLMVRLPTLGPNGITAGLLAHPIKTNGAKRSKPIVATVPMDAWAPCILPNGNQWTMGQGGKRPTHSLLGHQAIAPTPRNGRPHSSASVRMFLALQPCMTKTFRL